MEVVIALVALVAVLSVAAYLSRHKIRDYALQERADMHAKLVEDYQTAQVRVQQHPNSEQAKRARNEAAVKLQTFRHKSRL